MIHPVSGARTVLSAETFSPGIRLFLQRLIMVRFASAYPSAEDLIR